MQDSESEGQDDSGSDDEAGVANSVKKVRLQGCIAMLATWVNSPLLAQLSSRLPHIAPELRKTADLSRAPEMCIPQVAYCEGFLGHLLRTSCQHDKPLQHVRVQ